MFIFEYDRARVDLAEAASSRLLGLIEDAVETVATSIKSGDVKTALAVLKGVGLLDGTLGQSKPSTVEDVELDLQQKTRDRNHRRFDSIMDF